MNMNNKDDKFRLYDSEKLPYGAHGYGTLEVAGQYNHLDAPLGLVMRLGEEPDAQSFYSSLSQEQQNAIANYIKAATTGEEARMRVDIALANIRVHNADVSTY